MKFIVEARLYIEAQNSEQARKIARLEMLNLKPRGVPYTEGFEQFDVSFSDVLTVEEYFKKAQEKC